MIQQLNKLLLLLFFLLASTTIYADDGPGTGFEDEEGNVDESVEAPIDSGVCLLLLAGIAVGIYHYRHRLETKH